jgi:MFS-type transporter involved in bile tolerance (Atg22 family)
MSSEILPLPKPFLDVIASRGQTLLDCSHVHPSQTCLQYDVMKFTAILKTSLKVYVVIHILPTVIFKYKQLKKDPLPTIKKMMYAYAKSVAFLTLACSLPPILLCYCTKAYGKTNRVSSMISVTLAAITGVLCETEHRRREIGLFLWPKAISAFYNALVVRGIIPEL